MDPLFESTAWRRAATLPERLAALRLARKSKDSFDPARAERELAHWRAQPPFDRADGGARIFARRLEQDGIEERELHGVLGTSAESIASAPPAWIERLAEAYVRDARPLEGRPQSLAFLDVFEPLAAQARGELERRVGAPAARLFLPALLGILERLSIRSLALELGIARLSGDLEGENREARFESFVRRLRCRERAVAFLESQPVLARKVALAVERWRDAAGELVERLEADRSEIERTFAGGSPFGALVEVRGGAGDAHRGGRSVAVLAFDSGTRVVYKPRSLAVDAHFRDLVGYLNDAGQDPPLARLAVLDRGTHGWTEFVDARPCATRHEVRAFYRRQGSWLALFHALAATDLHYENVIAAGEHPVPVDLETLFHPEAPARSIEDAGERLARATLHASVLRVGLLPNRVGAGGEGGGADLGGLSGAEGQETPDELLAFEGVGTDEMRAVRKRAKLPAAKNRPELDGAPVGSGEHVGEILAGFRGTWELLRERREELLADDGPIARFAEDEVRVVLRATRFYGLLLEEGLHPDFQGDALELERHFDRLWTGVAELPALERLIPAERADLHAGDVPAFRARAGSRDLSDARGKRIEAYCEASGLELARARLRSLDDRERERQEWLIRGSIATSLASEREPRWPRYEPRDDGTDPGEAALRARALEAARAIGERLETLALLREGRAAWMGFAFVGTRWELAALPDDLYAGVPGVALFLEHLARATGEERFAAIARASTRDLVENPERAARLGPVGAFNGLGGLVYAFAHLAALRGEGKLAERAAAIAELALERLGADEDLDVVGGAAGLLATLESLHTVDPDPRWERGMRACAERIASRAETLREGVGWRTRIGGPEPATGFSHGAAGIGWALLRLHRRDEDARWLALARAAIRFEDTLLDAASRNWLDPGSRRVGAAAGTEDATTTTAWCYGAPGIGLARLEALDRDPSGTARRDLETAFAATLASGFGRSHCLCHGAVGNLEFLTRASEVLGRGADVRRRAGSVLASLERDGPLCGMPAGVESPALMNGLAGIGLGLLRIARPENVPSVLVLEAPRV